MSHEHNKTARSLRIYEYVDQDGVVFWSFTRLPGMAVKRLTLLDSRGVHFRTHIADISNMAFESDRAKKDG